MMVVKLMPQRGADDDGGSHRIARRIMLGQGGIRAVQNFKYSSATLNDLKLSALTSSSSRALMMTRGPGSSTFNFHGFMGLI